MIAAVQKFQNGEPPSGVRPGMFVLYESGASALIGTFVALRQEPIVKWSQLIEPFEMEWLQSVAVDRSLGVLK